MHTYCLVKASIAILYEIKRSLIAFLSGALYPEVPLVAAIIQP